MDIPRLTRKERIILGLLIGKGPMYGLQLVKTKPHELKRGTVYVTLSRMIDKGYVEIDGHEESKYQGGLPRPRYRPTGYGARVFQAWELAGKVLAGEVG